MVSGFLDQLGLRTRGKRIKLIVWLHPRVKGHNCKPTGQEQKLSGPSSVGLRSMAFGGRGGASLWQTEAAELRVEELLQAVSSFGLVSVARVVLKTVGKHELHVRDELTCRHQREGEGLMSLYHLYRSTSFSSEQFRCVTLTWALSARSMLPAHLLSCYLHRFPHVSCSGLRTCTVSTPAGSSVPPILRSSSLTAPHLTILVQYVPSLLELSQPAQLHL